MKKKNIVLKILNESKIINSALGAKKIEILINALDNREALYKEFENLSFNEKNNLRKEMKNEIKEIKTLDDSSVELFKVVNDYFKDEFNKNALKKSKIKKGNEVNKKYLNPYEKITVSKFDSKL